MRKQLTDDLIDALKPKAKRYIVMDSAVPWLGVRVAPSGYKSFVMVARFHKGAHPTRRALGKLTLDAARDKVRDMRKDLSSGIVLKRHAFGDVVDQFFAHIAKQRRAADAERIVKRELRHWWDKPVSEITKQDVVSAIRRVKGRGTPCAAHHLLAHMRRVFNYAVGQLMIDHSPCDRLRPKDLIGAKVVRDHVLSDDEIKALWSASDRIGYPYGPLWKLLLVTGTRRSEASGARWSEVAGSLWIIPAERFKSNVTHVVPLSPLAQSIIATLPKSTGNLFGHVNGWGKAKQRLDREMGDVAPFVIHDLRRTVRTKLSELRVPEHVCEAVLGHAKRGVNRIYNRHEYLDEKRDALDTWAERLSGIVGLNLTSPANKVSVLPVETQETSHDPVPQQPSSPSSTLRSRSRSRSDRDGNGQLGRDHSRV